MLSGTGISAFVISSAMSGAGQLMFGAIKGLQLTAHLRLFPIELTPPTEILFEGIGNVVMFDFYVTFEELSGTQYRVFPTTPTDAYSVEFDAMGYTSTQSLENLGAVKFILMFFALLALLKLVLLLIIYFLKQRDDRKMKKVVKLKKKVRLTNTLFDFMMGSFLELMLILGIYFKT